MSRRPVFKSPPITRSPSGSDRRVVPKSEKVSFWRPGGIYTENSVRVRPSHCPEMAVYHPLSSVQVEPAEKGKEVFFFSKIHTPLEPEVKPVCAANL